MRRIPFLCSLLHFARVCVLNSGDFRKRRISHENIFVNEYLSRLAHRLFQDAHDPETYRSLLTSLRNASTSMPTVGHKSSAERMSSAVSGRQNWKKLGFNRNLSGLAIKCSKSPGHSQRP